MAVDTWPPSLSSSQLEHLTLLATTYALSHGLVYLPVATVQPPAPTSVIHAPLALFPSPFPRRLFHHAQGLQRTYNVLYARIASDVAFLDRVMGEVEGVGKVDEFTGHLWRRWKRLRDERNGTVVQPLHLGLFRSDYLLHAPDSATPVSLKQVEFNTISSSFGPLSQHAAGLHRYLLSSTQYYNSSPYLQEANFPPNHTISGLAEGLAEAHNAYGVPSARILFVVQANERNVFDQRWLEYELLEKYCIHVVRQTLDQLASSAEVDPATQALRVTLPNALVSDGDPDAVVISVVYFRAGYTPTDYPTPSHYDTRYVLESSRAIQCPSIQLQLAGGKKVQQVLTNLGVLESFLLGEARWGSASSQAEVDAIRESWMDMWGLDEDVTDGGAVVSRESNEEGSGMRSARERAQHLVLKPQREGGGNNVYKDAIPAFLDALPPREREAWIAMELIAPPEDFGNYLVRAGGGTAGAVKTDVVSELGIFGWALFNSQDGSVKEKEAGWLVRTKGKDSNEGGVAAGFSFLDSIFLVD